MKGTITNILNEFNERLHSGNYTSEECYKWLESQSGMHPEIPQFAFLYPEQIIPFKIMKPKNLNNFKRLYWKNDKEQIMQIMHHLNIKYLLSLYKKAIHAQHVTMTWTWDCPTEDDWKAAFISVYQMVNYDGCQFQASAKTIKDELKCREAIGEVISVNHTTPGGRTFKTNWKINKDFKQNKN